MIPLVFYLNEGDNNLQYLHKADKLISLPESRIEKISKNKFLLTQEGNKRDNNIYTNTFEYNKDAIYVTNELVVERIPQGYIDEETGQVVELEPTVDTLHNKRVDIRIDDYNFRGFREKFYSP